MSEKTKTTLISVLLGLGTGLFMSIAILYMLILDFFQIATVSFAVTVILACAIPQCLDFLRKRETFSVFLIQSVMILTSFLITMIYGVYMSTISSSVSVYSSSLWTSVGAASLIVHGCAFGVTLLLELAARKHPAGMSR